MIFRKKPSSTPNGPAMKSIVYRGGVVSFRVPSNWLEEYSDYDGGMFYEDRPDSGTVRLKSILVTAPRRLHTNSAMDLLKVIAVRLESQDIQFTKAVRPDGNAVLKYEERASEEGVALIILYWVVANPLPPLNARIATFSYSIPTFLRDEPRACREIEMLEAEIEAATFSPEVGVVAE